jgi:hypothetical protein
MADPKQNDKSHADNAERQSAKTNDNPKKNFPCKNSLPT